LDLNQFLLYLSEWLGVIAVIWLVSLSKGFKPKLTGFRYPQREGYVSLGLFALIMVFAFFYYNTTPKPTDPVGLLWQRLTVAGISMLPFILALLIRGQPLRSVGWERANLGSSFRIGLALAFLTIFLRGKIYTLINGINAVEINAVLALVIISILEESIFRGYIQLRLSSWLGVRWGWLLTVVLFVFWQVPFLVVNPGYALVILAVAAARGLILGWLALKSGSVLGGVLYRTISDWAGFLA
jgi:membrane protease YdiL (CAAX protease family)